VGSPSRSRQTRRAKRGVESQGVNGKYAKLLFKASKNGRFELAFKRDKVLPHRRYHFSDILLIGQRATWKRSNRDFYLIEVDTGALEKTPLYKCRCQISEPSVAFRSGQYENLRSDRSNGKTPNAFFPEDRPFGLTRINGRKSDARARVEFAFRTQREPAGLEVFLGHSDAVIPKHEQAVRTVKVDLYGVGVSVMGVLEQLADRRWDTGDLLPPSMSSARARVLNTATGSL
jgi:hypothetical protein